ncbi:MAG: restriction endonuclease subunit S, partial [Anaerolineae bacterium]|nr:restriction endonuclease subunit S [Anaerolineae bacterium]
MKPIGDLLEAVIDYRGKTPPKSPNGIPALTAANVRNGRIDLSTISYVSEETYESWMTRGYPLPGDVLITTEAPVGEVASFPDDQTYLITRRLMALRGREGELDNDFLKYSLLYSGNQNRLLAAVRGSTVPRVLKPDILELEIAIPPYSEQRAIAHVLGTLDDKIELNRRMNATLEAMARAIFKSWFVDFDPVHAKARGEQPIGMDADTAVLFPDVFEESELGPIPCGWEVGTVGDEFDITMGQSPPGSTYNENG